MTGPYRIGVDLGGTKILVGVFDGNMKILARKKASTNFEQGGPAVFARLIESVEEAVREAGIDRRELLGMGLSVPGQIVPGKPIVRFAPNLGWRDFDLTPLLPSNWTWPIFIENDVRMGTYGEWTMGAAKGARHVFGIFAGTGVGGGLILNGELYNGFNGHAGEIGHVVIHWRRGESLEAIAGRRSLMSRAKALLDDAPKRVRKEWKGIDTANVKSSQLAEFYERDDPIAIGLIDDCARAIGAGIGSVINLLSPEIIVVGGGMMQSLGDPFLERIWEFSLRHTLPRAAENVRCVKAALGDDAGIIGAAVFARDRSAGSRA